MSHLQPRQPSGGIGRVEKRYAASLKHKANLVGRGLLGRARSRKRPSGGLDLWMPLHS